MTYERFEDLPVWIKSIELAVQVYALTARDVFRGQASLRDQIERAAVSVSNNIAEGFERGTTQELITFLYYARGSAAEVRSMLCLLERIPEFQNLKSQISNLKSIAENVSRQIRDWTNSLQTTPIKGQRHLTDEARRAAQAARARAEFLRYLEWVKEHGLPGLEADTDAQADTDENAGENDPE
jgi:four helix bundle protein